MIDTARDVLEGKNFAGTNFLSKKLGVTKTKASFIFRELGWTLYSRTRLGSVFQRRANH